MRTSFESLWTAVSIGSAAPAALLGHALSGWLCCLDRQGAHSMRFAVGRYQALARVAFLKVDLVEGYAKNCISDCHPPLAGRPDRQQNKRAIRIRKHRRPSLAGGDHAACTAKVHISTRIETAAAEFTCFETLRGASVATRDMKESKVRLRNIFQIGTVELLLSGVLFFGTKHRATRRHQWIQG